MAPAWLKARQTQYTAYAAVYVLVVLAVLAAGNFLANRESGRLSAGFHRDRG